MADAGLTVSQTGGRAVTIRSYDQAQYAFNLEAAAQAAVQGGAVTEEQAAVGSNR